MLIITFFFIKKWQITIIKKNKDRPQKEARERYQSLSE